jgi:2-polyprenyl-6-methoxyphenol hydroxylase-like FAD-dependent oxidoreductase
MDPGVLDATPEMLHNIPQPELEQVIADELAKSDLVEIRKGHSFVSVDQASTSEMVCATVKERSSGETYEITSRFLIGCDGRRSKVREAVGISSEGEDSVEAMMTIHFNADLRPIIGQHVGILHWIFDPEVSGFIIGYDLSGNLVLIHNFDPETHPVEQWTEAYCREVVDKAIGQKVPYDILSFRPWILSRKIARSYRAGSVLLAGDAAHSFPPNAGMGLNTAIADVHNLAYKVAGVLKGWASSELLDSYQADRRPIAEINALQSIKNGKQIFELLKALGTAGIEDPESARRNLYHTIRDPVNHESIQQQIEEQREHFDNLELHIGYVYGSSERPANASRFVPKFVPGARLPHAWIHLLGEDLGRMISPLDVRYVSELSTEESRERQYSNLDLCERDGFTILAPTGTRWTQRVNELERQGVTDLPPIYVREFDVYFEMADTLSTASWIEAMGLCNGRATVLRPDQHILCCLAEDDSGDDLLRSLSSHVGRPFKIR